MVTPTADKRLATASPFGLMADLGCVVAARLGMSTVEIARSLGVGVTNETARAAVIRGHRELAARRIEPARLREPSSTAPSSPEPAVVSGDSIETLLSWAHSGPQRAATLAARVRTLLGEIERMQQISRRDRGKLRARRDQRRESIPADVVSATERRAYFQRVRAWARENGQPVPEGRIVPTSTIIAYATAHASQPADEGDPHRPG